MVHIKPVLNVDWYHSIPLEYDFEVRIANFESNLNDKDILNDF